MLGKKEVEDATLEYFNGDELATNVFMSKYCLMDKNNNYTESSPDDMHVRLAAEFARIENKFKSNNKLSYDDIYNWIKNFKYIVPQGSPMYGVGNDYVNVSLSNCVVVKSPEDNVSSILNTGRDLANLFKRRCGVGLDISNLRPDGFEVNNSAKTTTGAWSFADFYSYVCRMIGQNGRRGALMITMDVRHPDIEKFIKMKNDLSKVTGANVSVKLSDDFMNAVKYNKKFNLQWPVDSDSPKKIIEIEASYLWDKIIDSATRTAEPGILMWDNIIKYLPAESYEKFKSISTNPCSEIPLSAYDSCRLISQNLKWLVHNPFTNNAYFDFDKLKDMVRVAMRMSDDLVELELEKLNNIISKCDSDDEKVLWSELYDAADRGRRTGLGTHGLADALARMCISYDSNRALALVDKIYRTIRDESYRESVNLAKERGSFPEFNWELEKDNLFIKSLPNDIINSISKYGRRNISILTNAPTGSVSIMSQTSSGIEPVFRNSYIRRRKVDYDEKSTKVDFIDNLGDRWIEFKVFHHNLNEYFKSTANNNIPEYFTESDNINWEKRIEIQSVIQKNIDHSISSTINLPKGTGKLTVGNIYKKGWEMGLKGITVYVDGSRSGVLISQKESTKKEVFPQVSAPKRPSCLSCDIHRLKVKGNDWIILVGILDGKPYEVMGGLSNYIQIPNKYSSGELTKNHRKTMTARYDLSIGTEDERIVIRDVVKIFDNPNHEVLTRVISLSLRHGSNINHVVEQLKKDKNSDMFSFNRCLARVLKKYIKDGTKTSSEHCPSCASRELIYQDGCVQCSGCGWSGCS